MALTGAQLLEGFSRFIGDWWSSTTTSGGAADGSTLIDTALGRWDDDKLRDFYFRPTGATNQYAIRRANDSTSSTGSVTLRPVFSAATATGEAYEMHRYDPAEKFAVLDQARLRVFPDLHRVIYDDSLTGDGYTREFDIPSTIRRGPHLAYEEVPIPVDVDWNFLADPDGDSTSNYTATGTTAATVTRATNDPIIPKYGDTITRLTTAATQAATYTMPVANAANSLTAALGADRLMTLARWVYCTEASKIRPGITDDSGTTYGSYHGGSGWELVWFEKTIAGNNATSLSAVLDIASTANASTIYVDRGWFYFGDHYRVTEIFDVSHGHRVERDDTTQRVILPFAPHRGYQIRLVGQGHLSALGTTAATQVTNTMEVDAASAELLYAKAARILFGHELLNSPAYSEILGRIQQAEADHSEIVSRWAQKPVSTRLRGYWAS